jgi:NADH:ubiquinone oxidoreductase subunit E
MLFTLQSVRCIGCCGLAPAVMSGDNVYGKLTPKDIPGIIEKYNTII